MPREEQRVLAGQWHDHTAGTVRFREYVESTWLPSKHLEPTTMASYSSNLNRHFFPFFGTKQLSQITPALVQDWVTKAAADGLSPRSICKDHTMLHSIFVRALRDQLILANPCAHTDLPKVLAKATRTLTPDEYTTDRRDPGRLPAAGADRDRDRDAVGRAHRAQASPRRLPAPHPHHPGHDHRGLQEALPDRPALRRQALTQGQRAPHLRRPAGLVRRRRRTHQAQWRRPRRPAVHHQGRHPDITQHLPNPSLAASSQSPRGRRRGPHARPTPRPHPDHPRNTSTPWPKPTNAISTPSTR